MPDAEEVQELGRQGVAIIKRWLEATTYIELPWDAYNYASLCLVPHLAGRKKFDLSGLYLAPKKNPIYVECKRYSSASRQYTEFIHFLGIAYSSALLRRRDYGDDLGAEFYWVNCRAPWTAGGVPSSATIERRASTDRRPAATSAHRQSRMLSAPRAGAVAAADITVRDRQARRRWEGIGRIHLH